MIKDQMELSFDNAIVFRPVPQRQSRLRRARWWFRQMRQAVDRALERRSAPLGRGEQIYFALTRDPRSTWS